MQNQNPDLLPPGADQSAHRVAPIAAITQELPTTVLKETHYYFTPVQNASMHRTDGKRLAFIYNVFATNIKEDIEYMEKEVVNGNPYVRHATADEIRNYNLRRDPRGTIKKEVSAEVEADARAKLLAELKEKGLLTTDAEAVLSKPADVVKLEGTESIADKLARMKAGGSKTPGATVIPEAGVTAAIKPVSTTDVAAGAAQSGR